MLAILEHEDLVGNHGDSLAGLSEESSEGSSEGSSEESSRPAKRAPGRTRSEFHVLLEYALKALARREHSNVELRRKLGAFSARPSGAESSPTESGLTEDRINQVIDALVLDGSLSDERFTAEFVRVRIRKGYGPIRIRMDLLERGVPDRLAEVELTRPAEFWQLQAAEVCLRKFGDPDLPLSGFGVDSDDLEEASPQELRDALEARKKASQRRWNRCARFLSQRGFPADLIYQTLDGRLLD